MAAIKSPYKRVVNESLVGGLITRSRQALACYVGDEHAAIPNRDLCSVLCLLCSFPLSLGADVLPRSQLEDRHRVQRRTSSAFNRQRRESDHELIPAKTPCGFDCALKIEVLNDVDAD